MKREKELDKIIKDYFIPKQGEWIELGNHDRLKNQLLKWRDERGVELLDKVEKQLSGTGYIDFDFINKLKKELEGGE